VTIEQALQLDLKEAVGHQKVFPDAAPDSYKPESDPPAVIYQHAGDDEQHGLSDTSGKDHIDLYTLEIWGRDRMAVIAIRDLLKARYRGANAQGKWGGSSGVVVAGAWCKEATGDMAPADDGSDRHDRAERLSLRIFWYG
jgi:hypothetical protein